MAFVVVEAELKKKKLAKKQEAELSVKTTQKSKKTKKPVDHYEERNQYKYKEEDVQDSESGLDSDIYIPKEKQTVTIDNQTKEEINQLKSNTNLEDNTPVTNANLADMKPLNNTNLEYIKPVVK